ncbi:PilT/PilU family type 4a pilus ATPase [Sulfurovum sp. bin170]|uniref:type IV pilus twitching motility protein PilT n=1 Tax=Sulfurovum sp. bin170 TaxID=2695268 RepID=UPI0013E04BDA|nr:PilT/PilU family type 4a pilus ATPase [Sulfurovum sp. bin170]NEW60829.1 PilT/PilU family type 4a pilus ATPase [Sulfurovum sp. bin170]
MQKRLQFYLKNLIHNGGSDLHLKSGSIIRLRVNGDLLKLGSKQMTHSELDGIAQAILTDEQYTTLVTTKELDCTYVLDEDNRFRVNFFYQLDGLSCVMRIIPVKILTLEELNLPPVITELADMHRGLILVTGVTGSGKSTTLAAMIDRINRTKKKHIITVEDPVEFVHQDRECLISQRGIGQDSLSFQNALKASLREDPDIILVGEMRDLETIEIALHAANTGHLVFSTLHTLDAKETINRVIGMFPQAEQNRIRMTLASVLEGVVSQRLVKTVDGKRAAAIEIMRRTSRIAELIGDNRDYEILDTIEEGKEIYGSQSFDQALLDLHQSGRISEEVVLENATNPSDMKLKLQGIGVSSTQEDVDRESLEDIFDLKDVEE